MHKYSAIFNITWSDQFVYRLNFVMWRFRMVVQLLAVYFLWVAVLQHQPNAFGYTSATMLTYIVGVSIIRSIVFSSKSISLQSDISSGNLNNFLIRPVNLTLYWLSRDGADKVLNLLFSVIELAVLYVLIRPPLLPPASFIHGAMAIIFVILAALLYFFFSQVISLSVFWMPEGNGWPQRFLIFVLLEFFAGGLFPLDILPQPVYQIIQHLPTAYMLNVPLQMYLGRIDISQIPFSLGIACLWLVIFYAASRFLLVKGLKKYEAYGY
jgi:ABC-2 type transport system permease protein